MPDLDDWDSNAQLSEPEAREPGTPTVAGTNFGSGHDWGLRNRLNRIFDEVSGHTVMLAFDHGYFQGPTSGLRQLEARIPPLVPFVDALMCTRGALRTTIPSSTPKPIVLRMTGGQSVLKELSNETVTVSVRDAVRLNVAAMAVQVYVGAEHEHETILNLSRVVDAGLDHGIPTLCVIGVGKAMVRDARYFGLATRIAAEMGAQLVKSYYIEEGFAGVVASCPVPIVIAGGKKVPELDALTMAFRATQEGAAGVDMGRNIFQSESPVAMVQAVRGVVHKGLKPEEAFDLFNQYRDEDSGN